MNRGISVGPAGRYALVSVLGIAYILPIYLIIVTSMKTQGEVFEVPPGFVPDAINLSGYADFFARTDVVHFLTNSVLIAVGSTAVSFVLGVPAAYGLARIQSRGRHAVGLMFLSSRFVPPISVVVAFFLGLQALQLLDTRLGLGIVYVGMNLPYVVWMMRGFFLDLPVEIEEAALVDGCSRIRTLWKIVLPVSAGGLAATAVLTLMFAWNEFLFALLLTSSRARTLPLSITPFLGESGVQWNLMATAGTLIMAPAIIFAVFVQKHMAKGLTFGAVK
jgi:multiple sugar transport system permease protein